MNAVIMAGGKGTRLQPLTDRIPKPMVSLFGRPVLEHQLALLRRQGIVDIIITVGHLQQPLIDYFGNGRRYGVEIRYLREDQPLGTAGGVKRAEPMLDDTFLVLSGDAVTDVDLVLALGYHRERRAEVTLVLKEVEDPSQYGIAQTAADGRLDRFLEKPAPEATFTHTANTGMYVMNRSALQDVPLHRACDFGQQLFPRMLAQGRRLFGFVMEHSYWNDIGSLRQYLQAHMDVLEGRVRLPLVQSACNVSARASIHPNACVEAPAWIRDHVSIDEGALIGHHTFVDSSARVGAGSQLRRCVIAEGCRVGAHSVLTDCVLSPGTVLPPHLKIAGEVVTTPQHGAPLRLQLRQCDGVMALAPLN